MAEVNGRSRSEREKLNDSAEKAVNAEHGRIVDPPLLRAVNPVKLDIIRRDENPSGLKTE